MTKAIHVRFVVFYVEQVQISVRGLLIFIIVIPPVIHIHSPITDVTYS